MVQVNDFVKNFLIMLGIIGFLIIGIIFWPISMLLLGVIIIWMLRDIKNSLKYRTVRK